MATYALPQTPQQKHEGPADHQRILWYTFLVFLALLCLMPIFTLLVNMTRSHGDLSGNGFLLVVWQQFRRQLEEVL
jgi:ABC-type glycerol-3-phosphate transport system permease component